MADACDMAEGIASYWRYRALMERLADFYRAPLPTVCAVFAALSPSNDYIGNLRSTVTLLRAFNEGRPVERQATTTFYHCQVRAWSYLHGVSFLDTVRGKKIRSFYLNILEPDDPHPVTVDGHGVSAWVGARLRMSEVANSKWSYEKVAHDFRAEAFRQFMLPSQFQGVLWLTWKRVNRILFDGQRDLFLPPDDWKFNLAVESILPFEEMADAQFIKRRAA